ncbi:hypothetical protein [Thioalkalivibrio sp. ALE19]|uniref:hypothetical protein n=1 Tax=Thioalkalivibrio sp. ALE19 TaxID=1266909 RepID=UPI0003F683B0|nr:hypothetical protein [Thioalkalivibrio sp. ALE19]
METLPTYFNHWTVNGDAIPDRGIRMVQRNARGGNRMVVTMRETTASQNREGMTREEQLRDAMLFIRAEDFHATLAALLEQYIHEQHQPSHARARAILRAANGEETLVVVAPEGGGYVVGDDGQQLKRVTPSGSRVEVAFAPGRDNAGHAVAPSEVRRTVTLFAQAARMGDILRVLLEQHAAHADTPLHRHARALLQPNFEAMAVA